MYASWNLKQVMAHTKDDRVAGEVFSCPRKVNSLQALTRLKPIRGCSWCTFAFVLNKDMITTNGSLDDLHAMVFMLGSFDNETDACKHAETIIKITGHTGVIAAPYGAAVPLTSKFNPNDVTSVNVDIKGRIIEMESAQYKSDREEHDNQIKRDKDIMREAEEETNSDSIEHFKRQCYLAIKNRASFQVHQKDASNSWNNYKKRETAVREHYSKHPEHETDWLPYLKEKLIERGEQDLYHSIETAYKEIRNELLGLSDDTIIETKLTSDDCSDGICLTSTSDDCSDRIHLVSSPSTTNSTSDDYSDDICPVKEIDTNAHIKSIIKDDDDNLISAEDVQFITESTISPVSNTCFVDESDNSDTESI
jgi:hypothetical protein